MGDFDSIFYFINKVIKVLFSRLLYLFLNQQIMITLCFVSTICQNLNDVYKIHHPVRVYNIEIIINHNYSQSDTKPLSTFINLINIYPI